MGGSKGQEEESGSKKKNVKFSSETVQKQDDKEESERQKKAQVELKIRQRVASEARAFDVVNRLIEPNITADFLQQACQFIDHSHYEDVVEERSIIHLCGYPLCSNPLKKVSKQKYHISTRSNTVYDITERKKFCSNRCYHCSEHLHRQIPETPVWTRRGEDCVTFDLLQPHTTSPLQGERIIGSHMFGLREEVQLLEKLDNMEVKDTAQRSRVSAPGGGGSSKSSASSSSSASTKAEQVCVSHQESQRLSQELLALSTEDDLGAGLEKLSLGELPTGPSGENPGLLGDVKKETPVGKGGGTIVRDSSSDERKPSSHEEPSGDVSSSGEPSGNPVDSSEDGVGPVCRDSSGSGSKLWSERVEPSDGGEGSSENPREEIAVNECLCKEDGTEEGVKGGKEQRHSGLESCMNKLTLRDDDADDDNLGDDYSGAGENSGDGGDIVHLSSSGMGETQTSEVCQKTPVTKTQLEVDSDDDDDDDESVKEVEKIDKEFGSMSSTVIADSEHSKHSDLPHRSATERSEDKEKAALISRSSQSAGERPQASPLQQQSGESKAAYLMRLLDRRKNLLSKVADVQSNVHLTQGGHTQTLSEVVDVQSEEVPPTSAKTQNHGPTLTPGRSSNSRGGEENKKSERREDVDHTDNTQCPIESSEDADSSQQLKKQGKDFSKKASKESEANGDGALDTNTEKKSLQPSSSSRAKGTEKVKAPAQSSKPCPLRAVCQVMAGWISHDTLDYLGLGHEQQASKEDTQFLRDPAMQKKYQDLCQRLAGQEKDFEAVLGEEEVLGEEDRGGGRRKPLPDYAELKKQTQQYEERVKQFLTGPKTKKKTGSNGDTEGDDRPVVLPAIDCHNQLLIRRRIVLERLDRTIPSLLPSLGLSVQEVSAPLRELVFTFSLSSHNIIFKPAEWTLAAIVLLKIMECRVPAVQSCFASLNSSSSSSIASSAFVLVLDRLGHSPASLTQLVTNMLTERSAQLKTPPEHHT